MGPSQVGLAALAILVPVVAWVLRSSSFAGWGLLMMGIAYIVVTAGHVSLHLWKSLRTSPADWPGYQWVTVIASHCLFLLAFLLQIDQADDRIHPIILTCLMTDCRDPPTWLARLFGNPQGVGGWKLYNYLLFAPVIATYMIMLWAPERWEESGKPP
jgi:hypothetical protein